MKWLEDGIVDFIISVYNSFFSGISMVYEEAMKTPSTFNGTVWDIVTQFNENAVLPIAWSILTLVLLFELSSLFKRADVKGIDGVYWIGLIFLKIGIAKMVMENMPLIIDTIFALASQIVSNGRQLLLLDEAGITDTTALSDALDRSNIVQLLGYMVQAIIVQIAGTVCTQLSLIVVRLRFIEIYVITAVASIPLAFFVSQEYGIIAKNYIKRLAGLALQVVFIIIVLYIYSIFVAEGTFNATDANPIGGLMSALGYSILMIIALFQTGGWAKSLFGAN